MKKLILLFIPLLVVGCVNQEPAVQEMDASNECIEAGGTWLQKFNECEYVSEEWCSSHLGTFSECESACRNEPGASICTLQCVPVCDWNLSEALKITSPVQGQVIMSPLQLSGQAPGLWFFEGDFPVELLDKDGNVLASSYVIADGEWMTEEWVDFNGTLEFRAPKGEEEGVLRFKKDNPSGRADLDEYYDIEVKF